MGHLVVHVFRGGLGLLHPLIGLLPLLQDDGISGPEVFLRLLQQAQAAKGYIMKFLMRSTARITWTTSLHRFPIEER